MTSTMPVLLTRPAAQAQAFASQINARFGPAAQCIVSPVLEMVFLAPKIAFTDFAALVFTSQNGVTAYREMGGPQGMVAYCVGDRTTRAAQDAGLDARSAGGDINALNAMLVGTPSIGPLLHPSGVHVAGQVEGDVTRVAVYDQRPVDLSPQALETLRRPGTILVPLFSPRSARVLQEALPGDTQARLHAICLSDAVKATIDETVFGNSSVSDTPTAAGVLDRLAGFFPP